MAPFQLHDAAQAWMPMDQRFDLRGFDGGGLHHCVETNHCQREAITTP
jgi:hypothetical protein